jgi:hypothetical protein
LLGACAAPIPEKQSEGPGKTICDSYIVMDMCVRDLVGDAVVDIVYFSDTREIFMYRAGWKDTVGKVMPFHQCAVALSPQMQKTTNRILLRENMSLGEELAITRDLISNYMEAKPQIDACNASFDAKKGQGSHSGDDFFIEEEAWEDLDG